eukprot:4366512-Ditylum_brightwellii.AAC.1
MLAKRATQLDAVNDLGMNAKALFIKLLAVYDKDNKNAFTEKKQCLEVEKFPKGAKEVEDLLAYETTDSCYKICP